MTIVQSGDSWQVRDKNGHLEVTCSTRHEAAAWIHGYKVGVDRQRKLHREGVDYLASMAHA